MAIWPPGKDQVPLGQGAVDQGQQVLHPPIECRPKPTQRDRVRHGLVQFDATKAPKQQIAHQLAGQGEVREAVKMPQKQRPEQHKRRITGPARRSLALATRQDRLHFAPVHKAFQPVEGAHGGMIQQVSRGEEGGLRSERICA